MSYEIMDRYNDLVSFESLVGKTFIDVQHVPEGVVGDSDAIVFTVSEDEKYAQYYSQDCCASCSISDITGELSDLVGSPVVSAYESSSSGNIDTDGNETETSEVPEDRYSDDSHTWTFYRISTLRGTVVIRWYGSSNGYYSDHASFARIR